MQEKVSIVKIGGNLIENEAVLDEFIEGFSKLEGLKILVHGGGKLATQLAEKLGIETKMVDGRRITDAETLKIITKVYGGYANKTIVAKLQARNCNAIGLSGADLNLIRSVKRPVKTHDFGFVGDVEAVNAAALKLLLDHQITPVCCAITHDKEGQLFNTNADTIASEIAKAISKDFETHLYYCFEKNGVLRDINDDTSVIEEIDTNSYQKLLEEKIIADGMLPKLFNCFNALEHEVAKVYIGSIKMITDPQTKKTTITL
ncbi:acetylglutamate kinase [Zhouia amylolytica]|uniref:Acetylglutamate kinase n=1 Tax=Zhouia amylolytica AD3 TaxID=1286632 RepID=W2UQE5_9FLAO|nr:acetylglutamate kinase [Zhouia amylolytica]ETN95716.1 acetylglutamate kinase [Zhouia amylolytica AD3]MCQ0112117.1 acetylglutamate kinase [Zhouia amylolytica]